MHIGETSDNHGGYKAESHAAITWYYKSDTCNRDIFFQHRSWKSNTVTHWPLWILYHSRKEMSHWSKWDWRGKSWNRF